MGLHYEVRPCKVSRVIGECEEIEECLEEEASFFGVYARETELEPRVAYWVADFKKRADAEDFANKRNSK